MARYFGLNPVGYRQQSWRSLSKEDEHIEPCCPLPFYLQDVCLLAVINDLESYPVELLASLPYWLRHRLLNSLPALELSRLENTPVADGLDTDSIWKSRLKQQDKKQGNLSQVYRLLSGSDRKSSFQLNISRDHYSGEDDLIKRDLELEMAKLPPGHEHLLQIASDLFCESHVSSLEKSVHQLISVSGELLLSNLLTGLSHHNCQNARCNEEVWKRQGTALVVKHLQHSYYSPQEVRITPRYLMSVSQKPDQVALLTSLIKGSQLRPTAVNVHINAISQPFLSSLCAERFALDSNLSLSTNDLKCTSLVEQLLRQLVILSVKCQTYGYIGLMISIIKATIHDGQESNLKHLCCAVPDLYMDILEPLSSLFLLQNFHLLKIDIEEVHPLTLSKLLQAFMTAPCQHSHKLTISNKKSLNFPNSIKPSQLAIIDIGGGNIPSCSIEHKSLEFSSKRDFTNSLYLLLQFSTVRLKTLTLVNLSQYEEYFHLCSLHPDLQVKKLDIELSAIVRSRGMPCTGVATIEGDLASLFKIQSLQKIAVRGEWSQLDDIKTGLPRALQGRSNMPPLTKLSLELGSSRCYKLFEFQLLCNALFSLPHLESLKLVLGKGYADMIKQKQYEQVMYKTWSRRGSEVKLKSICFQSYETKLELLPLMTQTLTFSGKPTFTRRSDLDFSDFFSDDFYGYHDDFDYNMYCYGSDSDYDVYYNSNDS